jgi:hypothetical protein
MSFCKISYGNDNENYQLFFYKKQAINIDFFKNQVNNVVQNHLKFLIDNAILNSKSPFYWVESCKENVCNIGYEPVNQESYVIDYLISGDTTIQLNQESLRNTSIREDNCHKTLFEVCIYSQLYPDTSYTTYFFSETKEKQDFEKGINGFLNQNVLINSTKMEAYIERLETQMKQNGFETVMVTVYPIYCDHKNKLSINWTTILGNELVERINNYNLPQQNSVNIPNQDIELPF